MPNESSASLALRPLLAAGTRGGLRLYFFCGTCIESRIERQRRSPNPECCLGRGIAKVSLVRFKGSHQSSSSRCEEVRQFYVPLLPGTETLVIRSTSAS